ncbi:hypothetical protein RRG08_059888 [Elysia crispata]|uniref:Uncharacterized protein n=1 Tax=Elysia crispata TaxID=231223 RepID=A0AAE0ZH86_9GAST|nr:hypothetical protein RRG08_059888 [Elysia crispata]
MHPRQSPNLSIEWWHSKNTNYMFLSVSLSAYYKIYQALNKIRQETERKRQLPSGITSASPQNGQLTTRFWHLYKQFHPRIPSYAADPCLRPSRTGRTIASSVTGGPARSHSVLRTDQTIASSVTGGPARSHSVLRTDRTIASSVTGGPARSHSVLRTDRTIASSVTGGPARSHSVLRTDRTIASSVTGGPARSHSVLRTDRTIASSVTGGPARSHSVLRTD